MASKQKARKRRSKRCFVVSVIGEDGSPERQHANMVLKNIIRPAVKARGYTAGRIDSLSPSGDITQAIVEELCSADLVVADLTFLNPNVMYELGIRQAWNLPLIQIARKGTKLPFDRQVHNTVFYGRVLSKGARVEAQSRIKKQIAEIEKGCGQVLVFKRSFEKAAEPLTVKLLYGAISWALRDLEAGLEKRAEEVRFEVNETEPEAFRKQADLVRAPLKTLRDKWHVIGGMAKDAREHGVDDLLAKGLPIAELGNRIVAKLEQGPYTRGVLDTAYRMLNRTMGLAGKLRADAEQRIEGSAQTS